MSEGIWPEVPSPPSVVSEVVEVVAVSLGLVLSVGLVVVPGLVELGAEVLEDVPDDGVVPVVELDVEPVAEPLVDSDVLGLGAGSVLVAGSSMRAAGTFSSAPTGGSSSIGSISQVTCCPASESISCCTREPLPIARFQASSRAVPLGPSSAGSAGRVSGTTHPMRSGAVTAPVCICRVVRTRCRVAADVIDPPSVSVTVIGSAAS